MTDTTSMTDALRADAYRRLLVSFYYNRHTSPSTLRMMVEEAVETLGDHGDLPDDDEDMAAEYAAIVAIRARTPQAVSDKQLRVRAYTAMDLTTRLTFLNWLRKDVTPEPSDRDFFADLGLASLGQPTALGEAVADGIFKRLSKIDRAPFENTVAA